MTLMEHLISVASRSTACHPFLRPRLAPSARGYHHNVNFSLPSTQHRTFSLCHLDSSESSSSRRLVLTKNTVASTTRSFSTKKNRNNSQNASQEIDLSTLEGYYDSDNKSSSLQSSGYTVTKSKRAAFKSIPINQSILRHIESIGVGFYKSSRSRPNNKNKRKRIRPASNPSSSKGVGRGLRQGHVKNSYGRAVLLENEGMEEKLFFSGQKEYRGKKKNKKMEDNNIKRDENDSTGGPNSSPNLWMPPPPFSAISNAYMEDRTKSGHKIQRLPIKILGSAGSLEDDFPRSSKGLPEVAIAGRSNVGKSTLLNALLYGNQFLKQTDDTTNMMIRTTATPPKRIYQKGKTPERVKLPKGIKADVSNIPGETKEITFYQLSSEILLNDYKEQQHHHHHHGAKRMENTTNNNKKMKRSKLRPNPKLSLVLADLPGYGFAYTSPEKAMTWKDLMRHFLLNRGKALKRVLLLLDARHGFKSADVDFLIMLQQRQQNPQEPNNDNGFDKDDDKGNKMNNHNNKRRVVQLPPIQIILTKCDLVEQTDLARRVVQVKSQLSDILIREPSSLPVMLVSAKAGIGFNNVRNGKGFETYVKARGGILELQRELAALVPR